MGGGSTESIQIVEPAPAPMFEKEEPVKCFYQVEESYDADTGEVISRTEL